MECRNNGQKASFREEKSCRLMYIKAASLFCLAAAIVGCIVLGAMLYYDHPASEVIEELAVNIDSVLYAFAAIAGLAAFWALQWRLRNTKQKK